MRRIFNGLKPCEQIIDSTGGAESCLEVDATILASGGSFLLVWAALSLLLTRALLAGQHGLSDLLLAGSQRRAAQVAKDEAAEEEYGRQGSELSKA